MAAVLVLILFVCLPILVLVLSRTKAQRFGPVNPAMKCPHCETKGSIRTKRVSRAKGVSGGKATAALLTGGVSILAAGLSRREKSTQAYCGNCRNLWDF